MDPINRPATPYPANGGDGSFQHKIDRASDAAHDTVDQMAGSARPAVDRIAAGAHETVDKASNAAKNAAKNAAEGMEDGAKKLAVAHDRLMDNVRSKPLAAVGIAVAAGFLLSRLFTSR
jgi:ElaB/YqjD/DUF883 family membrane-anchored ribosome-binding protein